MNTKAVKFAIEVMDMDVRYLQSAIDMRIKSVKRAVTAATNPIVRDALNKDVEGREKLNNAIKIAKEKQLQTKTEENTDGR